MCTAFILSSQQNANAEMRADGKWYFPDSIKSYCVDLEQQIVNRNKKIIEMKREWIDENNKSDKSTSITLVEALEKFTERDEISWGRLGCAGIIYGAKQ
jgi:hypothetical protein